MADQVDLPAYDALPVIEKLGAPHAWEVFGAGDELGRINLLTPEVVRAATAGVKRGAVFNLSLPLNLPDPSWGQRTLFRHTIYDYDRNTQDDLLDNFYLQMSTQWDGLRHVRAREFGFWGGVEEAAGPGGDRLGIEKWADHGLIGRGVLVDVERHLGEVGRALAAEEGTAITVDDLEDTLAAEHVSLRSGDILMLRTGYLAAYLAGGPADRQRFSAATAAFPGLHAGAEMARFLWDHGVAAVVADNPAVEAVPGSPAIGSLHRRLIPLLGFALGELFDLDAIAADCRSDGRYDCLFIGVPLNLPGGIGSPGNAVAVK
jgi:kynurenine formamidase